MKNTLITLLLCICSTFLYSQFWSEDFADGIPSEWEIEEISNIGVTWTYCPDTTAYSMGNDNTCPHFYNNSINGFQSHFKSDTPENGYATCVLHPFFSQLATTTFVITLTTDAIDCSAHDTVFVSFNSHIGVFRTNATQSVQLKVSSDKETWTTYFPHRTLEASGTTTVPGTKRWSKNPEKIEFDISEVAAGEDEIYIQWSWSGRDEYHWSIDDVRLDTVSSLAAFDISLTPNLPFQAIMPNFETPVSQIDTAYFLTDIGNLGTRTQTNILVTAQVLDNTSAILYSDTVKMSELQAGEIIEDVSFSPYFHEAGIGEFKITYEISSTDKDSKPEDNFFEHSFHITESNFAKNAPVEETIDLFPLEDNEEGDIDPHWAIANHFYIPNGGNYFLDEVNFEIPNFFERTIDNAEFLFNDPDIMVRIFLYEWDNEINLDLATDGEYIDVGQAQFIVTGADGISENFIKLINTNDLDNPNSNIPLKNDQHYFIALDYTPPAFGADKLFSVKASTQLNYNGTIRAHELQGRQRFASLNKIGLFNKTYNSFSLEGNVIPHIGFSITEESGVSTKQVFINNGLLISPNPADGMTQIKFNLDIHEYDKLELFDINGRLIKTVALSNGQDQYDLDCSALPNANYLLTYKSEKVISTTKLIVLH